MKKDSFYFPHDYNARMDPKITKLIMKDGLLGYGVFWALVESIYSEGGQLEYERERIAFDLRSDVEIVERVINDYGLFKINSKNKIYSDSINRRLKKRKEKSEKAKESANARWSKKRSDANALRPECDSNAIKERKKKGKENKLNDIYTPLAQKMKVSILQRSPNTKMTDSKLKGWSNTFRLMVEQDERTYEQIDKLITDVYAHVGNGGFSWGNVIMSASTLRLRLNEGKLDNLETKKSVKQKNNLEINNPKGIKDDYGF